MRVEELDEEQYSIWVCVYIYALYETCRDTNGGVPRNITLSNHRRLQISPLYQLLVGFNFSF